MALAGIGGAALAAVFYAFDPAISAFFPRCLIYAVTGVFCPGCGGQRALHALLHGEVGAALGQNALLVAVLPVAGVWGARHVRRLWRGEETSARPLPRPAAWALVAVVIAFTVLRNLPWEPFVALAPDLP